MIYGGRNINPQTIAHWLVNFATWISQDHHLLIRISISQAGYAYLKVTNQFVWGSFRGRKDQKCTQVFLTIINSCDHSSQQHNKYHPVNNQDRQDWDKIQLNRFTVFMEETRHQSEDDTSKAFSHASWCADVVAILHGCNDFFASKVGNFTSPLTEMFLVKKQGFTCYVDMKYGMELFMESNGLPLTPSPSCEHLTEGAIKHGCFPCYTSIYPIGPMRFK